MKKNDDWDNGTCCVRGWDNMQAHSATHSLRMQWLLSDCWIWGNGSHSMYGRRQNSYIWGVSGRLMYMMQHWSNILTTSKCICLVSKPMRTVALILFWLFLFTCKTTVSVCKPIPLCGIEGYWKTLSGNLCLTTWLNEICATEQITCQGSV